MTDKMSAEQEALVAKMIADGIAAAMAAQPQKNAKGKKKAGAPRLSDEEKAKKRAAVDAETVKNFKAAGYKDVQPRVNVLTYGKLNDDGTFSGWLGQGRRVKKGEKAIKCGSFPLFHKDQTEPFKMQGTVH